MFKALAIANTPKLHIMSMERREELAAMPITLNGRKAVLLGLEEATATIYDPKSHLCQPWPWDAHLERMLEAGGDAQTLSGWRTTSYFAE